MRREVAVLVAALAGAAPPRGAEAQATGMPSYNAPYRAFQRSELGGVFSFPEGGGTAFEGVYRYASGKFDIGLRGGFFDPGSGFKTVVLAGVEARQRVITHTVDFPLDGALMVGAGANLVSGGSASARTSAYPACSTRASPAAWATGRSPACRSSPCGYTDKGRLRRFGEVGGGCSADVPTSSDLLQPPPTFMKGHL